MGSHTAAPAALADSTATQPLCKKYNKAKDQQPLEDWQEQLKWLTHRASKKAKRSLCWNDVAYMGGHEDMDTDRQYWH